MCTTISIDEDFVYSADRTFSLVFGVLDQIDYFNVDEILVRIVENGKLKCFVGCLKTCILSLQV